MDSTANRVVWRSREARYGGGKTNATPARAQKCLTSFPVPVAVHKTVGAKSPYFSPGTPAFLSSSNSNSIWNLTATIVRVFAPASLKRRCFLFYLGNIVRIRKKSDRILTETLIPAFRSSQLDNGNAFPSRTLSISENSTCCYTYKGNIVR